MNREKLVEFGDVVAGKVAARGDDDVVLVDLTGVGAQRSARQGEGSEAAPDARPRERIQAVRVSREPLRLVA